MTTCARIRWKKGAGEMSKPNSRKIELEKTRSGILEVASDLFMEKGFKNTSTREIAEKCHITQPNLYHHFKNKKELYIAVIEELTNKVQIDLFEIINEPLDIEVKLTKMVNVLLEKHPTNLFLMLNDMFVEMADQTHANLYVMFKKTYVDSFMAVFQEPANAAKLRPGVSVADGARFVLYNVSAILSIQNTYQKTTKQKDIDSFIQMMLYGISNQ